MRHLDLFSGIGGFALAARNMGWETIGFCEIDPYCQKVLAKHWPGVPIYDDITKYTGAAGHADVITGGFPCQDISHAGKQAGIEGERSGLWTELARVIGEVRPRYAVLENVSALLSGDSGRWFQRVLGDLASLGYDCEWHCIPASAVGAPHRRDRVWIVAYPNKYGKGDRGQRGALFNGQPNRQAQKQGRNIEQHGAGSNTKDNANAYIQRLEGRIRENLRRPVEANEFSLFREGNLLPQPTVRRGDDGFSSRVDRLRGLGNAIVPQVAQVIFEAING